MQPCFLVYTTQLHGIGLHILSNATFFLKVFIYSLKMMFFRNLGNVEETKRKHQTPALSVSSFCYVRTDDKQIVLAKPSTAVQALKRKLIILIFWALLI